jgi:hypothetical protein
MLIVLAGIFVGQVILYGPSLIGPKILLPLDLLARPNVYLPQAARLGQIVPHDSTYSDLVVQFEPERRFGAAEVHAGRWPSWTPYQFAGCPAVFPRFSPFWILKFCFTSPVVIAWVQLIEALVAGSGAYLFCRGAVRVGFWPAAVAAWCYPLTGFFVLWQGIPVAESVPWLPWILLAVDRCVRKPSAMHGSCLAATAGLVLVSGNLDVAGQVLLGSGLYAGWCLFDAYCRRWSLARTAHAAVILVAGWGLGFMLASPYVLPLVEYTQTGSRMQRRGQGEEERPPVGLEAMPRIILPYVDGTTHYNGVMLAGRVLPESPAATYTGLLAVLVLAPLAWCSRRHRSQAVFFLLFAFLGLAWELDVPGVVDLLRMPLLRMMSYNRLVFWTSLAILSLAAIGLEALWRGAVVRRWWFWFPAVALAGLGGWCLWRTAALPEPLATEIAGALLHGQGYCWIRDFDSLGVAQAWFLRQYLATAILAGLGVLAWMVVWFRPGAQRPLAQALGFLLVIDLLWFGFGLNAQCDPALYYPRIPILAKLAAADDGRIVGMGCLPATLSQTHNLRDIRGYDSIDSLRLMELIDIATPPESPGRQKYPYAATQWFRPRVNVNASGEIWIAPVLDMLGVKYLIFRGAPLPNVRPDLVGDDYWVLVNSQAMPRVYVPQSVETVADDRQRLQKLADPRFQPKLLAYVEQPVALPAVCRGSASIRDEIPTRVTVSVDMQTPGLVVLADLWDQGWRAYRDGKPVEILRANHALRGVLVPAGKCTVEFRYEPASFARGLWLAATALAILLLWNGAALLRRRWPNRRV